MQYTLQKQKFTTKTKILAVLKKQGFSYNNGKLVIKIDSKEGLRNLNTMAVHHLLEKKKEFIEKRDEFFVTKYIANGNEIEPDKIKPKLIYVNSEDKEKNDLFNWVKLHWSIPISAGYGRRLRYLVMDDHAKKLIGIIGLADPVYALRARDSFIGWDTKTKNNNLRHIMDGFVIGSVPPYSLILGGKLVASLIASDKVSKDFHKKYSGKKSIISGRKFNGKLVALTTSSAFGKSSMYDRIKIPEGPEFVHVGWTKGSGEFHFSNGEYKNLFGLAKKLKIKGKNKKWGKGPRNKRVVVCGALKKLGMPKALLYHGIERELFLIPLAENWKEILSGKQKNIKRVNNRIDYISSYMIKRWIIPRSIRDDKYKLYKNYYYSLLRKVNG